MNLKGHMMNTQELTKVATGLITAFGSGAHRLIDAWRDGGLRLNELATERWNAAMAESAPQLSAETQRNAEHAREVLAAYWQRGIAVSADGATVVVDSLVDMGLHLTRRASDLADAGLRRAH